MSNLNRDHRDTDPETRCLECNVCFQTKTSKTAILLSSIDVRDLPHIFIYAEHECLQKNESTSTVCTWHMEHKLHPNQIEASKSPIDIEEGWNHPRLVFLPMVERVQRHWTDGIFPPQYIRAYYNTQPTRPQSATLARILFLGDFQFATFSSSFTPDNESEWVSEGGNKREIKIFGDQNGSRSPIEVCRPCGHHCQCVRKKQMNF